MNLRKLIREAIDPIFNENGIVGIDIIKYLTDIPETREEVKWEHPRTFYTVPTIDNSFAHTEVYDKEFFTGWDRPYMSQGKLIPSKSEGYVSEFENRFNELPRFKINGRKIEVLNPKFRSEREDSITPDFGTPD